MMDEYGYLIPNQDLPRWDVVAEIEKPFMGSVALGNVSAFVISMQWITKKLPGRDCPFLQVSIEGKGSYGFSHYVHWTYAMEKLGLSQSDARNVADLINAQLKEACPDQGYYGHIPQ